MASEGGVQCIIINFGYLLVRLCANDVMFWFV